MKTLFALLAIALLAAGCTSRTEYGECKGIADDHDPTLEYKVSAFNLAIGFIFSETIIVPVVVLADETTCPVGVREGFKK